MLSAILANGRSRIMKIVNHWLAAGATQVSIWSDEQPLDWWPPDSPLQPHSDLCAPLHKDGAPIGDMRIVGLDGEVWMLRLQADVEMIDYIVELEQELDLMTVEMINQQEQLVGLYQITQSTRSKLTVEQILASLAKTAAGLIKAEITFATYSEQKTGIFVDYFPKAPPARESRLAIELLARRNKEILINSVKHVDCPPEVDSFYFTPIQSFGTMTFGVGTLNKWGGPFQSPDIKLLKALAEHAAAQIENAILHDESIANTKMQAELETARNVQLRLLPSAPPTVAGLGIFASSTPALQVGGDFFDFIQTSEDAVHFTVGDVSGKGMPAAMLMAMSRTVIRNLVRNDNDFTPGTIFERANADLYDDFTEVEMFATVFCGHFDGKNGTLTYLNAGQSPVIYRPVNQSARFIDTDGPAMGVLPMNLANENQLPFQKGDILIVATDGFSEARNEAGELYGYERLLELVDALARYEAEEIGARMFGAILDYSVTQEQDDDQTLIILKGK